MLSIRSHQADILAIDKRAQLIKKLAQHCRDNWVIKVASWDDQQLSAYIEDLILSANAHSITVEKDLAYYVNLSFIWGADFADNNDLTQIFKNNTLNGSAKIFQLRTYTKNYLESGLNNGY